MSRCTESWAGTGLLAMGLLLTSVLAVPASAQTTGPEPLPRPDEYPTAPLVPRSFPLVPVTGDRQGVAESAISPRRIDVRIAADVAFGKDSDELTPAARRRIAQVAASLASRAPGRVRIEGHTDDLGSAEHGLDLSRRRAEAVRRELGQALEGHHTTAVGRGEDRPIVPNTDEQSRSRNRRVELLWEPR